jgi:hypothetical protein
MIFFFFCLTDDFVIDCEDEDSKSNLQKKYISVHYTYINFPSNEVGLFVIRLFGTNIATGIFSGKIYRQGRPTATYENFRGINYIAYHNSHVN